MAMRWYAVLGGKSALQRRRDSLNPLHETSVRCLFLVTLGWGPRMPRTVRSSLQGRLFAYPDEIARSDDGSRVTYDYREARDINGRDEIPERRVKGNTSLSPSAGSRGSRAGRRGPYGRVGRSEGASVIVLYLHGQGGSRKQGVDDFTSAGNFNRLKYLVAASDGLYLSPRLSDFGDGGAAAVDRIVTYYAARSRRRP